MASQQIPLTGTGEILIKYTESGETKSLTALSPTTGLYLDDSNTDFKYKVLSGSVTIGSTGSITFTEIVSSYKKLVWDAIYDQVSTNFSFFNGPKFYYATSLIIGSTTYNFDTNIPMPESRSVSKLSDAIFKLNNPNIKPKSYKIDTIINGTLKTEKATLILSIEDLTDDIYLKIVNDNDSVEYLVKASYTLTGVPAGYTVAINSCVSNPAPL